MKQNVLDYMDHGGLKTMIHNVGKIIAKHTGATQEEQESDFGRMIASIVFHIAFDGIVQDLFETHEEYVQPSLGSTIFSACGAAMRGTRDIVSLDILLHVTFNAAAVIHTGDVAKDVTFFVAHTVFAEEIAKAQRGSRDSETILRNIMKNNGGPSSLLN